MLYALYADCKIGITKKQKLLTVTSAFYLSVLSTLYRMILDRQGKYCILITWEPQQEFFLMVQELLKRYQAADL